MLNDKELSMVSGSWFGSDAVDWVGDHAVAVAVTAGVVVVGGAAIVLSGGTAAPEVGLLGESFCETYVAPALATTVSLPL